MYRQLSNIPIGAVASGSKQETDTSFQVIKEPWHRHQHGYRHQSPGRQRAMAESRRCVSEVPKKTQSIMDTPKAGRSPNQKDPWSMEA